VTRNSSGYTPVSKDEQAARQECAREHRGSWRVVRRNCNYSAFNGYRRTWSRYSGLTCLRCLRYWRTCAGYVASTPDISAEEMRAWSAGIKVNTDILDPGKDTR
jgi:hypothetical protein